MYSRDTGTTRKLSIDLGFTLKEGGPNGSVLEFDGNLIARVDIGCLYTVSKSLEANVTRHMCYYLCRHRRSCHHQSYSAADIYRPRVNPDFYKSLVSIRVVSDVSLDFRQRTGLGCTKFPISVNATDTRIIWS